MSGWFVAAGRGGHDRKLRLSAMERGSCLFKLINGLRYFGVGAKVKQSNIKFPGCYWVVSRVKLSPDQNHGKVYGRFVWKGASRGKEEQIRSPLKKEWHLVDLPDYSSFTATAQDLEKLAPLKAAV